MKQMTTIFCKPKEPAYIYRIDTGQLFKVYLPDLLSNQWYKFTLIPGVAMVISLFLWSWYTETGNTVINTVLIIASQAAVLICSVGFWRKVISDRQSTIHNAGQVAASKELLVNLVKKFLPLTAIRLTIYVLFAVISFLLFRSFYLSSCLPFLTFGVFLESIVFSCCIFQSDLTNMVKAIPLMKKRLKMSGNPLSFNIQDSSYDS